MLLLQLLAAVTTVTFAQIPEFSLVFTRDNPMNPAIPYVGSNISYTCQILVPSNMLKGLTGVVEISDPRGTPLDSTGDRVKVSETTQDGNTFICALSFSPLSAEDEGEYRCTGTLQPATPNPSVTSRMQSVTQTITIIALQLRVELTSVSRRHLVFEPLSLTCLAIVMIRNDPAPLNIEFSWLRSVNSGPREELTSDLYTNSRVFGSAETNNLTVLMEQPGNHTYTCQVNLDVRPAPDVMMDERSIILEIIRPVAPLLPASLTTPSDRVFDNNVTVQWLVTSLSYGPESYRVLYGMSGAQLDMESPVVTSGDDITVTNFPLSVQLTGLMPATTYCYRLEVNNSFSSLLSLLQCVTTTNQLGIRKSMIGTATGFSMLVFVIFILCGVIVAQWKCNRKLTSSNKATKIKADLSKDAVVKMRITRATDNQMCVKNPDPSISFSPIENATDAMVNSHQYEDVRKVVKPAGANYQLTQNEAYRMTKI